MSRQIPWGRVLVEGAVIVASILLAFGIEASWAERSERRTEQEELRRVFNELTVERGRILSFEERQAARVSASLDFVDLVEALGTPIGTIEAPDSMLATFFGSPSFEAQTPALDGLLRSGSFSVVRDVGVRTAIASLERALAYVAGVQGGAGEFMRSQLLPAFIDRGDMSHVLLHARGARRQELGEGVTQVRVDPRIGALVSYRYIQTLGVANGLERVRVAMDAVLAAIDATLPQ